MHLFRRIYFWGEGVVGFMPLFRCLFFGGGERVGFMPLFRCIYFFIYFFLKVWLYASF